MKPNSINNRMNSSGMGSAELLTEGNRAHSRGWTSLLVFFAIIILPVAGMAAAGGSAQAGGAFDGTAQDGKGTEASGAVGALPDCGPNWAIVSSANPDAVAHPDGAVILPDELWSVAVVSSHDVWAVGDGPAGISDEKDTLIEHWNGSGWSTVSSPSPDMIENSLRGVAAASANDVWAVGNDATTPWLIEHWNGTTWSVVAPAGGGGYLTAVAVVSANDVWAVGDGPGRPPIEHWNGTAWTAVTSPNPGTGETHLNGLAVVSANDVWAVGSYLNNNLSTNLIEHWNGTAWSIVASPNKGTGSNNLNAAAAVSANNVWAVGSYESGTILKTLTEQWNGTAWTIVNSDNQGTTSNSLSGVAVAAAGDIWAVGSYVGASAFRTLVEHWNGSAWSIVSSPNGGTDNNELVAVAVASANDVWGVGSNGTAQQGGATLVERYNPCPSACTLQFEDVPNPSTYYAYVRCLACRGIIDGYPCGGPGEPCNGGHDPYFQPNNNVTRGQIAKIVALSIGIRTPVSGQTFEDVPPGSTFYTYTEQLYAEGVMNGYPCGGAGETCNPPANRPYFRPNANASRGQLAKIDANAAGYSDPPSGQSFEDVAPGSTFYTYTQRLTSRGVMSGYPCGGPGEPCIPPRNLPNFRTNYYVTRGQTSKIVGNTFYPNCQTPARR